MNNNQRQEDGMDEPALDLENAEDMKAARNLEGAVNDGAILNPSPNEQVQIENAFDRALGNTLVRDKILFFLNFEDMKALSAVSLGCYSAVRNNEEYKKRAILVVCQDSVASHVLQETCYNWKQISIDLSIPVLEVEQIACLLPSAKAISLWLSEGTATGSLQIKRYLTQILGGATDLECLEMDTLIFKNDLTDVFSKQTVQTRLANLEVLAIQSKLPDKFCYVYYAKTEPDFPFERNLRLLAEMPLKLKKFVFGKVVWHGVETESRHVQFIPKIINATKDTLEELKLHPNVWQLDEMMGIRCSKLKRLAISAHGTSQKEVEIVEAFLRNQPPLEELDVEINKKFLLHILPTFPDKFNRLKKLYIVLIELEIDAHVNMIFLETMNQLKDFRIEKNMFLPLFYPPGYKASTEFLAKLPSGLEKISIRNFSSILTQMVMEENIGDLLSRYVNLTDIDLWNSGGVVTDMAMQNIIINCKKLTSFAISSSLRLTDFGISGVKTSEDGTSEEKVGVSLKDLKGLIRLKIQFCCNVSAECMLKVVEFDFLRFFYYDEYGRDLKAFLAQIARQNPCLEEALLGLRDDRVYNDQYVREMKQEMKRIYPRVCIKLSPV